MSATIAIEFEGERIEARAGESLASALTAHGIRVFRVSHSRAERGLFCGMGVCQDCLVEVDGRPNQRACMTKVDRPMVVRRETHARPLPGRGPGPAPVTMPDLETIAPELLVVGAGPGGLSAAIAAKRVGAEVLVLDERSQAGGQYFKQIGIEGTGFAPPDLQHREGAALIESALRLGVEIRTGVLVWGAFAPNEYAASADGRTMHLRPKAAIIATGAYERAWPVPGWTLPGVMTTGAAQTLWRTARRLPGQRVMIAGNGPLNLQLAAELIAGGAQVVAVVEAARRPRLNQIANAAAMLVTSPKLVADGLRRLAACRSAGASLVYGMVVGEVEQVPCGLSVRLVSATGAGDERRFEVDTLCLGYGFEPSNELLRALGCGHDYETERRQLVTRRDSFGHTDVAGVYALGDCTGLGGARVALAEGTIVGTAAARALGHPLDDGKAQMQRAKADLARHQRFQRALWRLYAAPAYSASLATSETPICRCEEVTFEQIDQALDEGMSLIGAVKRRTRVGMGRCQGRYCAPVLDALLAEHCGRQRDEFSGFAPRVPVKPIAIEDLVRTVQT